MLGWFEQHLGILSLAVATAGFVLLSICEAYFPRRHPATSMGWRWLNNLSLFVVTSLTLRQTQLILPISAALWVSSVEFGVLQIWQPGWVYAVVITFLVMDFSTYVYHRLLHGVPLLWQLHAVHHSDTEFDLTTTYRNHPFVAIFLQIARLPVIVIMGAPLYAIAIYELANIAFDLFSHSNVRIPERLENRLRHAIVTPDFHRTHHSSTRRFTNSNFSGMFPVFDHLFGTASYKPYKEHEKLEVGLEYLRSPRDTRLDQLLMMPFRKFG
jgi:sterol desaturase/sphingolipid hydroxylase (fatty acid hydroxylase superfamily)